MGGLLRTTGCCSDPDPLAKRGEFDVTAGKGLLTAPARFARRNPPLLLKNVIPQCGSKMITPRTGRKRGRPPKAFLHDQERYALGWIAGIMAAEPNIDFEHAALYALALYEPRSKPVELPASPLKHARRLKLSRKTQDLLKRGYHLFSWNVADSADPNYVQNRTDTLRKKAARFKNDPVAQCWLYHMRVVYMTFHEALLGRIAFDSAELIIKARAREANELEYAERHLLPILRGVLRGQ
jgi:hypothetical protein